MHLSLRTLLAGAVDYAGFFSPQEFTLERVVRNYIRFRQSPEKWLLGRLVLPAGVLDDLSRDVRPQIEGTHKLRLSIIVGGGWSSSDFDAIIDRELAAITRFISECSSFAQVEGIEIKLPRHVPADWIAEHARLRFEDVMTYVEPGRGQFRDVMCAYDTGAFRGVALPCGAMKDQEFADALIRLRESGQGGTPVKFIGDAAYVLRPVSASASPPQGFINKMAVALLSLAYKLDAVSLGKVLAVTAPGVFHFSEDAMRLGEWSIPTEQIERLREKVVGFSTYDLDRTHSSLRKTAWY